MLATHGGRLGRSRRSAPPRFSAGFAGILRELAGLEPATSWVRFARPNRLNTVDLQGVSRSEASSDPIRMPDVCRRYTGVKGTKPALWPKPHEHAGPHGWDTTGYKELVCSVLGVPAAPGRLWLSRFARSRARSALPGDAPGLCGVFDGYLTLPAFRATVPPRGAAPAAPPSRAAAAAHAARAGLLGSHVSGRDRPRRPRRRRARS
jgi:hypothetical protein